MRRWLPPSIYTGYDLSGNILYSHYGSAGGAGVDYVWDALGRKVSETSYGRTVSSQYDLAGNRTRLTYPDGNYFQYTYDALNRMQQVRQNGSTVVVQYTYDDLGRVKSIVRDNGAYTNYSYDSTDLNWSFFQNLSPTVTFGMTYTPAGQVHDRSISSSSYAYSAPALTQSYTPDGLNRYASVGGASFSYDGRGNLTSDGSRSFSYDLNNRLTGVSGSASMSIAYDPLGRLQQTTASSTEQYLYDDDDLLVEYDGSGNILRRYVPGPNADQPLMWFEGSGLGTPNWLHTDQQGSIIAASNYSGTVATFKYGPNGEPSGGWGSGTPAPIFRYTGQAALAAAKLYYYKARVYDPVLGRFLQTDPVGYTAGLNLYAYAGNDPVNAADPSGNGPILASTGDTCQYAEGEEGTERTCSTGYRDDPTIVSANPTPTPASPIIVALPPLSQAQPQPDLVPGGQPVPAGPNGRSLKPKRRRFVCGGVFDFAGVEGDAAAGGAFVGGIKEYDTVDGPSGGALFEAWGGGEVGVVGAGKITTSKDKNAYQGVFGFGGVGLSTGPLAGAQVGVATGNGWSGFFIEGHLGYRAWGTGAYLRTSCKKGE